jgi:hypothetical protein
VSVFPWVAHARDLDPQPNRSSDDEEPVAGQKLDHREHDDEGAGSSGSADTKRTAEVSMGSCMVRSCQSRGGTSSPQLKKAIQHPLNLTSAAEMRTRAQQRAPRCTTHQTVTTTARRTSSRADLPQSGQGVAHERRGKVGGHQLDSNDKPDPGSREFRESVSGISLLPQAAPASAGGFAAALPVGRGLRPQGLVKWHLSRAKQWIRDAIKYGEE